VQGRFQFSEEIKDSSLKSLVVFIIAKRQMEREGLCDWVGEAVPLQLRQRFKPCCPVLQSVKTALITRNAIRCVWWWLSRRDEDSPAARKHFLVAELRRSSWHAKPNSTPALAINDRGASVMSSLLCCYFSNTWRWHVLSRYAHNLRMHHASSIKDEKSLDPPPLRDSSLTSAGHPRSRVDRLASDAVGNRIHFSGGLQGVPAVHGDTSSRAI
jgi:hypothetical protein